MGAGRASADKVAVAVSLSQNRTRLVGRLRTRKLRAREGAVLVEGVRAVDEALRGGGAPAFAVVSPRLAEVPGGQALRERLEDRTEVVEIPDSELEALSDTEHPQGVLAVLAQPEAHLESLAGEGFVLMLDAVQDPGNVGTLVRSAVAFGLAGVICLDGTTDPWGAKAVRASAGLVFRIPVWSATLPEAAKALAARGAEVLAAAADGRDVRAFRAGGPGLRVLVLGNEGAGVRPETRALADSNVAVPMRGGVESLNVGVAGSILMYECTRGTEAGA